MANQNQPIQAFYEIVKDSEELQRKLAEATDQDSFSSLAAKLGKENGYDFTPEDVNTFVKHHTDSTNVELCDEELAMVAGGKRRCPLNTRFTFCALVSSCWGSKC